MAQTPVRARRALVVEPSGNLWGSERVLLDFLRVAVTSAWEIAVCCPPDTPILGALGELPIQVFETFQANLHLRGRAQRARATLGLLRAAREFRPDVLYVNQAGATRITLAVGRLLRLPVVTHVRLEQDAAYVLSLGASAKALPKVICISRFIRQQFPAEDAFSSRLEMLYDPYTRQREGERAAPLSESEPSLPTWSCVGRLESQKRQDVLLDAIAGLQKEGVPTRGLFIGAAREGDPFFAHLQHKSEQLGIGSQIMWAGFRDDVLDLMTGSTALVCPFEKEALGRVVFEGWDAGVVPVVWKGSGGPAEVVEQSGGGVLYEEQSGASLAKALRGVLETAPSQKQRMVEAGRAWMRENCDPAHYTARMLELWEGVARPR